MSKTFVENVRLLYELLRTVDPEDDGRSYHQVVLELVEVEELPPVFAAEEVRLGMSSRFKLEGNEQFAAGDYIRSERGEILVVLLRRANSQAERNYC